jgi:hypothetical protein
MIGGPKIHHIHQWHFTKKPTAAINSKIYIREKLEEICYSFPVGLLFLVLGLTKVITANHDIPF